MRLTTQQEYAIRQLNKWKVGALFMEPGTGKTRVAVKLANSTPCTDLVWIAPLRTIDNVREEIGKSGGVAMTKHFYGVESLSASDRIYLEVLEKVKTAETPLIVVDESLKIKNADAKRTRRVLEIGKHAQWKLVLNGTPVSRNLLDMWPQMEFLSPKILGMSLAKFKDTFTRYTTITKRIGRRQYTKEYITGMENVDYLHSLIRPYVYQCDLSLQISQEWNEIEYKITSETREVYDEIKTKYLSDEELEWRNNNIFLCMTTEMQMSYALDAAKLEAVGVLMEQLEQSETIIFCRFISSIKECRRRWPKAYVLSLQKSSFGLNLQQYSNMVFFDRVWDYALMLQASRRTFRTGQAKDCRYYELTGNVGLEAMMRENIRRKTTMSEYLKTITKQQLKEIL